MRRLCVCALCSISVTVSITSVFSFKAQTDGNTRDTAHNICLPSYFYITIYCLRTVFFCIANRHMHMEDKHKHALQDLCTHKHTHTHTHALQDLCTHKHTHTHTHMLSKIYAHTNTHTHTHTHTHTCSPRFMHTNTHIRRGPKRIVLHRNSTWNPVSCLAFTFQS